MFRHLATIPRFFARTSPKTLSTNIPSGRNTQSGTSESALDKPDPLQTQKLHEFSIHGLHKKMTLVDHDKDEDIPNAHMHVQTGRSWLMDELRIKSSEELHQLWYILLREKNRILSDAGIAERLTGEALSKHQIRKVEKSMRRLAHVVKERKGLCNKFRRQLEDNYCDQLKQKLDTEYQAFTEEQKISPPISYSLLRSKFEALRKGRDNTDYIEKEVKLAEDKIKLKNYLRERYAYGKKKIVNTEGMTPDKLKELSPDQHILSFKNHIEQQLAENKTSVSQEEVLRAHVKNWKVLNLKQRRVVLHLLNDRRAKDAKSSFVKELNLLAQKIAYEENQIKTQKATAGPAN